LKSKFAVFSTCWF